MGKLLVTLFAPPGRDFVATLLNFCSCTQDKFVMVIAPGHPTSLRYVGQSAHLHAIKIQYTLTVFWLRSTLYRDTAPVFIYQISGTKTTSRSPIKFVLRPRQHVIKFVPGPPSPRLRRAKTAKSAPYPPSDT
jgi:hypothetical protein